MHHPWRGCNLGGRIVLMPSSRGSGSGSGSLLDRRLPDRLPAARVVSWDEEVLTLGGIVAVELLAARPYRRRGPGSGAEALDHASL